jgi:hypothetical protein
MGDDGEPEVADLGDPDDRQEDTDPLCAAVAEVRRPAGFAGTSSFGLQVVSSVPFGARL